MGQSLPYLLGSRQAAVDKPLEKARSMLKLLEASGTELHLLVHRLLILSLLQSQLKNSPDCLKVCRPLKGWSPCVCTESSLRSHTRVFRQLFGAVFSQPRGNKKCWRSCACSVVCRHLSLLFHTALWWITDLPWRARSMHKNSLKICKLYSGTGTKRSQMQSLINVKACRKRINARLL